MGKYDDTVNSFTDEEGTVTVPENVLEILAGAHAEDIDAATTQGGMDARADISAIINEAVTAAVAGVKAEAFDALLETGVPSNEGEPDDTESGANGSENDDADITIDDLFATN